MVYVDFSGSFSLVEMLYSSNHSLLRSFISSVANAQSKGSPFTLLSNPLRNGVASGQAPAVSNDHIDNFEKISENEFNRLSSQEQEQYLLGLKAHATSREEYQMACKNLDLLQSFEQWKEDSEPDAFVRQCGYDPEVLDSAKSKLDEVVAKNNVNMLLEFFETHFSRKIAGIDHSQLYAHSHHGTKALIEDYTESVMAALALMGANAKTKGRSREDVVHHVRALETALKHYGRTALTLSGGATLGMKHFGVVKALFEADVLPQIMSGTSAGSIVAGVICCHATEELPEVINSLANSEFPVFCDMEDTPLDRVNNGIRNFISRGALFHEDHLAGVMKVWTNELTFMQAYNLTGRKLCIGVSAEDGNQPQLLTYQNAPNVLVWSAICASCAVPVVFRPAVLYEKCPITKEVRPWQDGKKWVDGSLDADIPKDLLSKAFGVKNFIVSQVNPHVRIFTGPQKQFTGRDPIIFKSKQQTVQEAGLEYIRRLIVGQTSGDWTTRRPKEWRYVRMAKAVLRQEYSGNINILPEIKVAEFAEAFDNPGPALMKRAMKSGERAAWCHMSEVYNSCAIELALVQTINELKTYIHFGEKVVGTEAMEDVRGRETVSSGRPTTLRRRTSSLSRAEAAKRSTNAQNGLLCPPTLPQQRRASASKPHTSHRRKKSVNIELTAEEKLEAILSYQIFTQQRMQEKLEGYPRGDIVIGVVTPETNGQTAQCA